MGVAVRGIALQDVKHLGEERIGLEFGIGFGFGFGLGVSLVQEISNLSNFIYYYILYS